MRILDAISLDEIVPIVMLIFLLNVVGTMMSPPESKTSRWAARIAAVTFIAYAIAGLVSWPSSRVIDALVIVARAILAGGLLWAVAKIALPAFTFVYDRTIGEVRRAIERARQAEESDRQWQIFDWMRTREYEAEQRKLEAPDRAPEPPPRRRSREEIASEAKDRYEAKLAIIENASMADDEREAAKLKAKQHYFQELDGAL